MQSKRVIAEEMNELLELSKNEEHPFFYNFSYQSGKGFFATRVRKDLLSVKNESRAFHSTNLDPNGYFAKAINRIERAKNDLGQFAYGR